MVSINFSEVSNSAGIASSGESFGGSWGDFNDDGFLDLWVTNHSDPSILYLNDGNGGFIAAPDGTVDGGGGDTHGTAWADFDNDGDRDLIETVGGGFGQGTGPNNFFINENGTLQEQAEAQGVDYPLGRSRTPLWVDYNNDSRLDLVVTAISRPSGENSTLFRQNEDGTFSEAKNETGFSLDSARFAILADVTGDDTPEIIAGDGFSEQKVFDTSTDTFTDVTDSIPFGGVNAKDMAAADFNGDLKQDLYLVNSSGKSDISQSGDNNVAGYINLQEGEEGLKFNSSGSVTFDLSSANIPGFDFPPEEIFIGSTGFNPDDNTFTLSPEDADVAGIVERESRAEPGAYIGYDETTQTWQLVGFSSDSLQLNAVIESDQTISDLESVGFDDSTPPPNDRLLLSGDEGLENKSQDSGINSVASNGGSIVTGDFDNDRDVDIYIVATTSSENQPNVLYENQGDGTFVAAENAAGAEGSTEGLGDSAFAADYDNNGFLDVFVTNGRDPLAFGDDGPVELFRNEGNDNHWLQIDLEGTTSNKDGIGAKVFVTSGGVTQVREQSGGVHRHSQNQQRVHFGLADSNQIDEIVVQWPSGIEQKIENVSADQIIDIVESSEESPTVEPSTEEPLNNGNFTTEDFQGQPDVNIFEDSGLYLWQDDNNVWNLRAVAGGSNDTFSGTISGDVEFEFVHPDKLESNDVVDTSNPNQIDFDLKVYDFGEDIVQFKSADSANISLNLEEGADSLKIGSDALAVNSDSIELLS